MIWDLIRWIIGTSLVVGGSWVALRTIDKDFY